jgi:hypothetical protein
MRGRGGGGMVAETPGPKGKGEVTCVCVFWRYPLSSWQGSAAVRSVAIRIEIAVAAAAARASPAAGAVQTGADSRARLVRPDPTRRTRDGSGRARETVPRGQPKLPPDRSSETSSEERTVV